MEIRAKELFFLLNPSLHDSNTPIGAKPLSSVKSYWLMVNWSVSSFNLWVL